MTDEYKEWHEHESDFIPLETRVAILSEKVRRLENAHKEKMESLKELGEKIEAFRDRIDRLKLGIIILSFLTGMDVLARLVKLVGIHI